jgi:hypothetical protein
MFHCSLPGLLQVQFPCFYHPIPKTFSWSQLVTQQLNVQPATISLILTDSSTLVPLCVVYRGFRVSVLLSLIMLVNTSRREIDPQIARTTS